MIDTSYPAVPVELAIDAAGAGRAGPLPLAAIAHAVVAEALAAGDLARAERAARVAHQLLPGDEVARLDLARVRAARRGEG